MSAAHDDHGHGHAAAPAGDGPRVLSISEKNPKVRTVQISRPPMGMERAFLPAIVKGLGMTAKHFFKNTFRGIVKNHEVQTIEYPDVKPDYPARYRGLHRLMHREDGSVRCVACMMCPTVCPAHCITIHPGERADSNEKYPVVFEIDELRCVVCGLCVEACPCDAIRMDTGVHMHPVQSRGDAVLGKVDLMKLGGPSTAVQGGIEGDWQKVDSADSRSAESAAPAAPR
jgi:NADH-quinone oxidoreductase subunit I